MTKICTKCKNEQPLSEFWKNIRMKDGLYQHCKTCGRAKQIEWRDKMMIKEYKPDEKFGYNNGQRPMRGLSGRIPKKIGRLPTNDW